VFGWTERQDKPHAVDVEHPARTLCGARVFWLPGILGGFDQPVPSTLHGACRRLLGTLGAVPADDTDRHGVCPVCGGEVPVKGDLVGPHGMWRLRDGVGRPTSEPCAGEGQGPEG
jgi:hypothetical protein